MLETKNLIIIILSVLLLIVSIAFVLEYNKNIKAPKPIVKTIEKEKIVYIEKPQEINEPIQIKKVIEEEEKKQIIQQKTNYDLPDVEVPLTENEEYVITSTRDHNGRFTISLTSLTKPPKEAFYDRKVILKSEIEADEYIGKFSFLVPPILVENISDLNIKITDAVSGDTYTETAYCIDGISSAYDYSMNISFSDGFSCYIQKIGESFKVPKPSKETEQRMQEIFEKLQSTNNHKE